MTLLDGYAAVVTGAATPLGAATALELARCGARVALADRERPEETADRITRAGGTAHALAYESGDQESTAALLDTAAQLLGGVDLVVTGAFGPAGGDPVWDAVFGERVRGTWLVLAAARPHLARSPRGNAVVLTPGSAWRGEPGALPEVSAAGGLLGLVRAVAREVGDDGTRVNLVGFDEDTADAGQRCLKGDSAPADVAAAVALLASPRAGFVTGQTLLANGGSHFN
ncbi:SDR family NAD(P)-dependent oxidoreductase [Streptomyces sp. NPDC058045]|uniref:SDR family NAD(P)-dependent oxidoreductase n=1 Tax=Streptomyces sp. NPDC058045 TaxID=3346311 RepID=UPI0036F0F177